MYKFVELITLKYLDVFGTMSLDMIPVDPSAFVSASSKKP
jgi:hypothetical protein